MESLPSVDSSAEKDTSASARLITHMERVFQRSKAWANKNSLDKSLLQPLLVKVVRNERENLRRILIDKIGGLSLFVAQKFPLADYTQ